MYERKDYLDQIDPFIGKPLVKVITGIRRAGKSTLLRLLQKHLQEKGIPEERVLYLNMESLDHADIKTGYDLHRWVRSRRGGIKKGAEKTVLFVDEIQYIHEWERAVNSLLADDEADVYLTGSNSQLLSSELATLLTGRTISFEIQTLTLSEFALFRRQDPRQETTFQEFLLYGGFPGLHHFDLSLQPAYQYISSIVDSILLKDVVARKGVRDVALLEKILWYVVGNVGSVFSARRIADFFKNERRTLGIETVYNYLSYLCDAFLVHRVPRYDVKGRQFLEVGEKYYLGDLGIRHALLGYREQDINAFLENLVYLELLKRGYTVYLGRFDDYEIDFIAERNGRKMYLQVCYLLATESVREREFRPLFRVEDNYPKFVLSLDRLPGGSEEGVERWYLPDFLCAQW